jgi:hypothetical protein
MISRTALLIRIPVPRGALALAALLSVLLGAALSQLLGADSAPRALPARALSAGLSRLPVTALGPVSSTLGADGPAYLFSRSGGGFQSTNRAQRLSISAGRSGVLLSSHSLNVSLSLRAVGFGSSLRALAGVAPTSAANRVTYLRPALSEWYSNGPLGLEQGFTVTRAPAGDSALALNLAVTLGGNARASLDTTGQSLTLTRAGAPSLHYGALSASDASGRALPIHMALDGGQLLLRVDARGARYPLRIDPLVTQEGEQKLTGILDEAGEARLGYSVALSGDGNTALIGGPRDGNQFGSVWVFVRSGATWVQQGPKLAGEELAGSSSLEHCGTEGSEEESECYFGRSVALSADGNTAIVGNPRESRAGMPEGESATRVRNAGAAWLYTRSSEGKWTRTAKLTGGEEGGEGRFGKSVALSGDGQTALIGGSSDNGGHGSAWAFARSGEEWTQQGPKLTPAGEVGEGYFGVSVALSKDGSTAVIGGSGDSAYTGAAWIFARSGTTWSQQVKLTGAEEVGEGHFGYSVALSADGSTALVGARGDSGRMGAAWVFARSGLSWLEQGSKLAGSEAGDEFGYSVALSGDGSIALVGGPRHNLSHGAAWLYQRSGTSWSGPEEKLQAGVLEVGRAWFGASVALSSDARTALVGAPNDKGKVGAAWVFGPSPVLRSVSPDKGPAAGGTTVTITGSNFTGASAVHFGTAEAASFEVQSPNTITAVTPPGAGVVDVTVTTAYGASSTGTFDRFTYVAANSSSKTTTRASGTATTTTTAATATATGGVLGFGPTGGCGVTLISKRIAVQAHSRAAFRLRVSGAGKCAGKLRLRITRKIGRRAKLKTIGTAVFSITAGRSVTIKLNLNAAGRALLRSHHGQLNANLLIVRQSPRPSRSQAARVRLALSRRHTSTVQVKVR